MNKFQKQVLERWKRLIAVPSVEKNPYRILKATIQIPNNLQKVKLSGKSLWGAEKGFAICTEANVEFHFDNGDLDETNQHTPYYIQIFINHNRSWEIYTDKAFERGVSQILTKILKKGKVTVFFTEQGMQENCIASMGNSCSDWTGSSIFADYVMKVNDL